MGRNSPDLGGDVSGPAVLAEWRLRTKTSQQQLAEKMGLKHPSSIYLYEAGKQPFTFPHLIDLQHITGISVWALATPEQREVIRELAAMAIPRKPRRRPYRRAAG